MVKLIYGLAKFSNKNYGFGSRPKNFDKKISYSIFQNTLIFLNVQIDILDQ